MPADMVSLVGQSLPPLKEFGIPALTGMYVENPALKCSKDLYIIETANSAAGMRKACRKSPI